MRNPTTVDNTAWLGLGRSQRMVRLLVAIRIFGITSRANRDCVLESQGVNRSWIPNCTRVEWVASALPEGASHCDELAWICVGRLGGERVVDGKVGIS